MANNIPELILKDISVEDGKKILDVSNLPTVTMCATLEKVFIDSDECPGIYKITDKKIGNESSYGSIFLTCCESEEKVGKFTSVSNNCDYVAKWQPIIDLGAGFKMTNTSENMINEARLQYIAARRGLAPMIREVMICEEGSIIIMDALTITAQDEILADVDDVDHNIKILKTLLELLKRLHSIHIFHGDPHFNNFMRGLDGEFYLIDFGKAQLTKNIYIQFRDYEVFEDALERLGIPYLIKAFREEIDKEND